MPTVKPTSTPVTTAYKGPCDVGVPCSEAYDVARAATAAYSGPLFQLVRTSDNATLNIGQTATHIADTSTWSTFCGGVQANCLISKIYAQIHTGPNDLVPSVFDLQFGPHCSTGGAYACACPFTLEAATGLPIATQSGPCEYTLANDGLATGIPGGSNPASIMLNGIDAAVNACCGTVGMTHKYNGGDTHGTDFMLMLSYGSVGTPWGNCGGATTYCVGFDVEGNLLSSMANLTLGSSPKSLIAMVNIDPVNKQNSVYANGAHQTVTTNPVYSDPPQNYPVAPGTAIHVFGGGDLSQPGKSDWREWFITNTTMSSSDYTSVFNNMSSFFNTLSFQ